MEFNNRPSPNSHYKLNKIFYLGEETIIKEILPTMINAKNMQAVLELARSKETLDVAIIAMGDEITVTTVNCVDDDYDPTAHAPMLALRELGAMTHQTTFPGYSLYTPMEPCPMCAIASLQAGLEGIYYGLPDKKRPEALRVDALAHAYKSKARILGGVQQDEVQKLMEELK